MAKAVILKINNGKTVQKLHSLFRVEEKFPLLRKNHIQPPYFSYPIWMLPKSIHKYGREIISTIGQQMMHKHVHDTLIPYMLEGMVQLRLIYSKTMAS